MDPAHPTEVELIEWFDANHSRRPMLAVDSHVRACLVCQSLMAKGGEPIEVPEAVVEVQPSLDIPERREVPAAGEVWRLSWDDVSELALVWRAIDDYFRVVPLRPDPEYADERTVVTGTGSSILPGDVALWFGLESSVPLGVFDRYWFEIDLEPLGGVRAAIRERKPVEAAHVRVGAPVTSALDARYEYREDISDRYEQLTNAHWRIERESSRTLADLVNAANATWSQVTTALGLEAHERLRLQRSQYLFRAEDAARLAVVLDTTPEEILATNPPIPPTLAAALDQPRWKPRILEERRTSGLDEAGARYRVAFAALALAARESAPPSTEEQWDVRLEHVFAT